MKLNSEQNSKQRESARGARSLSRSHKSPLSRARSQLSQAVGGVLSGSLVALEGRLGHNGWLTAFGAGGSANAERLRDVVERDRALFAAHPRPRPTRRELGARSDADDDRDDELASDFIEHDELLDEPARATAAELTAAAEADGEPDATSVAPAAAREPAEPARRGRKAAKREPIRTRTMARLLAQQGHKSRALSIYDELIAADAEDASLQAEAASLRDS
jgi:hypothetical protein